ncbi:MAG: hypothetical protein OHK0053_18730 [Microscillaceae bacterium]
MQCMDAYRLVNQFSSELHGQLNAAFQIEWLNNQFWACLKYAPGAVPQQNLLELCAQTEDQHILRQKSQALQNGQASASFKITLTTQLGESLRLKMKIVRGSEATFFMIAQPLVSDVEPTTRFRRFFDLSLLDMVVILNQGREIIYANHGMDYEPGQSPKITFEQCFSSDDKPRIVQLLQELVWQEGQARRFTGQIMKKDGQRAWIDWSILFAKGNYYGVGNDVSEKEMRGQQIQDLLHETVALNQQLEEQNQMLLESQEKLRETLTSLEQRNTELDQFVYRVSHDIRAPLASVMGLINLIRTTDIPVEEFGRYHELMDYSLHRLDQFTSNLIVFLRAERSEVKAREVDFAQIVHECYEELFFLKNADRLDIRLQVAPGLKVASEPMRLRIIFGNMISNAIKYQNVHTDSSFLEIKVRALNESHFEISFLDNGIGIPGEAIDKIFSMFYRGSELSDGSGLGLYIVRQVVQQLQGELHLESQPGQGAKFTFVFPFFVVHALPGEMPQNEALGASKPYISQE